jgi:hypothetical protein
MFKNILFPVFLLLILEFNWLHNYAQQKDTVLAPASKNIDTTSKKKYFITGYFRVAKT